MARRSTVLIVDDDVEYVDILRQGLSRDFEIMAAHSADEASRKLAYAIDVVLLDLRLNGESDDDRSGILFLDAVREQRTIPVIIMTAYADVDVAVETMKLGAFDFIQKSRLDLPELRRLIQQAADRSRIQRRMAALERDVERLAPWDLIGGSERMNDVRVLIDAVAKEGKTTVLIRGETGTGKELVARAVHSRGVRKNGPFVPLALPGVPATLIEGTLFGSARGAYTDAKEARTGYARTADGGVLFLDEIGELDLPVQPKLLRFLDSCTFAPLGTTTEVSVDVQVVCATNRDLEQAVANGGFRNDLYYRLRATEIVLPPLRDRLDDVPLLVDYFLFKMRRDGRPPLAGITAAALDRLCRYGFPGNVRELQMIISSAAVMASMHVHAMIDVDDLPQFVTSAAPIIRVVDNDRKIDLDGEVARAELACIERALEITEGRKSDAWKVLGLNDRYALLRRVKRIRESHPDLINDYPILRTCYVDQTENLA